MQHNHFNHNATMQEIQRSIDVLAHTQDLSDESLIRLIREERPALTQYLHKAAESVRTAVYGKAVYVRGLIEFTNYCKNDCLYCGIRSGNRNAKRYRLSKEDILRCCRQGETLGFRTFVLQGGEDPYFTDEILCDVVQSIKAQHPGCAVTLSVGERSRASYQKLYDAGADRYLLRHETAGAAHYAKLHPAKLTLARRMACLQDLKDIGFQVGCGFMVGSPYQTDEDLLADLRFIQRFRPEMCGIGPFLPHCDTPFHDRPAGSFRKTLNLLSILRLLHPNLLLPATTALGTIHPNGRELGILAGANVVMPNLSPSEVRKNYLLYDNKICTGDEAAEHKQSLAARMQAIGYELVVARGDYPDAKPR